MKSRLNVCRGFLTTVEAEELSEEIKIEHHQSFFLSSQYSRSRLLSGLVLLSGRQRWTSDWVYYYSYRYYY
ncbi:unnamed protein product [Amoebophrya sp. A25]|nr:unnamed protein product [Amoebophrya sp. A25]|eukprot:GSA25T00008083001.1